MNQSKFNLAVALVSLGAVVAATMLQLAWKLHPCTMCIAQRYAFMVVGVLAVSRIGVRDTVAKGLRVASYAVSAVGVLASLKIQWAIWVPADICGRDKLAAFFNSLPWVSGAPTLKATGICGDYVPPVLWVPFHIWSLALFCGLVYLTWRSGRSDTPVASLGSTRPI